MAKLIAFHVSLTGNDRWDGSAIEHRGGRCGPFRTLPKAQAAVRRARQTQPATAVTVWLRGGRHELAATLCFTSADGGTAKAPVVWAAWPGERPLISGGRVIAGWQPDTVKGISCWRAQLPEVAAGTWRFRQLFVDGLRRPRPRIPKAAGAAGTGAPQQWLRFASTFGQSKSTWEKWGSGPDHAEYKAGDLRSFRNLDDVELIAQMLWFEMPMRITAIEESTRTVRFHRQCLGSLVDEEGHFARYYVDNVVEALDTPGEWYLDRPAGRLNYIPHKHETPESTVVIAPWLTRLVQIQGSKTKPVEHLRFENLSFADCEWLPPADYRGSIQAAFEVPGALLVEWSQHVIFYGCEVTRVAQYGIQLGVGSHDCRVIACTLHDLGAGGVRADHEWLKVHDGAVADPPTGRQRAALPRAPWITDCDIHHGGRTATSAIGVFIGNVGYARVLHNHIHDLRYTGISVGWTWGHAPTATVDTRIENNHVHHINEERYFSDNGAIYTLGCQPGSTIRRNLLHHVSSYGYGGDGIYPDEGSSGFVIEDNLVSHCRHAGYSCHYGRDLLVRNNVFAWSELEQVNTVNRTEEHAATVFTGNIVAWKEGVFGNKCGFWRHITVARDNVLWPAGRALAFTDGTTLATWTRLGQFGNTLIADPLFTDADGGDYTLRADSPAIAHGFKPFALTEVGPRARGTRPSSYLAWLKRFPDPAERAILFARLDPIVADLGHARVRLTIRNPGRITASGTFTFRAAGVTVIGGRTVQVQRLAPGGELTIERTLRCPPGVHTIEVWPSDPDLTPAVATIEPLADPRVGEAGDVVVQELPVPADPAVIPVLLAKQTALAFTPHHADLRLARCGEALAISITVRDARIAPAAQFSEGSCVELFFASSHGRPIAQIVLTPTKQAAGVTVLGNENNAMVSRAEIPAAITATANGYTVATLIPLTLLKLPPDAHIFRFDAKVTAFPTNSADGSAVCAQLFTAGAPPAQTVGMARVRIPPAG